MGVTSTSFRPAEQVRAQRAVDVLRDLTGARAHWSVPHRAVVAYWVDGMRAVRVVRRLADELGTSAASDPNPPPGPGTLFRVGHLPVRLVRTLSPRAAALAGVVDLLGSGCSLCGHLRQATRTGVDVDHPDRVSSHPALAPTLELLGDDGVVLLDRMLEYLGAVSHLTALDLEGPLPSGRVADTLCRVGHLAGLRALTSALDA